MSEQGPEMTRLLGRLFDNQERKLLNFNVFPGPNAHLATKEELAAQINSAMDQIENGTATVMEDID